MSLALKLKDSSVLEEFEIPEHLGGVVDDLKKEQQTLKKEIDVVKSQAVVRKQDESTRIFNLRQHQIELKIAELEEKKKQTEKDLQGILQQKNSTLHTDLKKLAQFILQESRKIAPLEKELEAKIGTISNLRNELQQIFESNLSDRKKNMGLIEEQNVSIMGLGDLIRDTSKLIQGDFHFLTQDIQKLQDEKQSETRRLAELKLEVAHHQGISDELISRKKDLKNLEKEIADGQKNALAFAKLDHQLEQVRNEILRLQEEREKLENSTERLKLEQFHGQEEQNRLLMSQKHLENTISGKHDQIKSLELDLQAIRIKLEKVKEEEQKERITILQHREYLSSLKNDTAKLEGSRSTYTIMLEEAQKHFEEKKSFSQRESDSLEKLFTARTTEFEASLAMKKLQWEEEFHQYCEKKKATLKSELEQMDRKDLEEIRSKRTELLHEVSRIMSNILNAEGFLSSEERTHKARTEVEKTFEFMFGKTRRWKFW